MMYILAIIIAKTLNFQNKAYEKFYQMHVNHFAVHKYVQVTKDVFQQTTHLYTYITYMPFIVSIWFIALLQTL